MYLQGELAFTFSSVGCFMLAPHSTAPQFYSMLPCPSVTLPISIKFPWFISFDFFLFQENMQSLIFNCCTTTHTYISMHKIYTTRIDKSGILPAKSRHKGAKNFGVFDIVELEGTLPQTLERVDDLPLRPVGAFQNSKYSGIRKGDCL